MDRRSSTSEAIGLVGKAKANLGLFDTPPNRQEIQLAVATVALQLVLVLVILPLHDVRWGEIGLFVPLIDAIIIVGELIIATKLYAQAAIFRSRALTLLASGYVVGALILIPHALTFPGAFSANGLLGAGVNTTIWLSMLTGLSFPISAILYVVVKSTEPEARPGLEGPSARVLEGLGGAIALAVLATIWTTIGHDLLPPLFLSRDEGIFLNLAILSLVAIVLTIAAITLLYRQDKSVLDMWLLVALCGWAFQLGLTILVDARFTVGWYGLFALKVASSFIIMVALIAETNRLYSQLALHTAARERQRDDRLMSMDAVAAAIAHEAGQPLTAVALNVAAGLNWLDREKPDPDMAMKSFRTARDECRRTFDVMKSVRGMFAKQSGSLSEFSLNDLVRETAMLLDRELAAQKVSLRLELDESLPSILANRVQLQRVLVNLLTNAIESVGATRRQSRRIEIRSASLDNHQVLFEVSDSGAGIAPEKMAHIFEPFVTTKSTGTGLGLSLSRTIVEEHGGRLWASPGERHGAIFHVQLPRSPLA